MKATIDQLLASQDATAALLDRLKRMESNAHHLGKGVMANIAESQIQVGRVLENLSTVQREIENALPEYVKDRGVYWAAGKLGISVINMFPAHLESMLSHQEEGIREIAVRCGDLNDEQLQKARNDHENFVRQAAETRFKNGNKPLIHGDMTNVTLESVARIG